MIDLTLLRDKARLKRYQRGAVIAGPGSGVVMFSVLKGEICVVSGYPTHMVSRVSTLSAGSFYVEPSSDGGETDCAAIAVSDAIVLPVERTELFDIMRDEPEITGEIIRELAAIRGHDAPPDRQSVTEDGGAIQVKEGGSGFELFPEGHGESRLPVADQDPACLMNKTYNCPACGTPFTALTIRPSKLTVDRMDSDMRYRYKGVEPLYYEALTCPTCLYSSLQDVFGVPERRKQDIAREVASLKSGLGDSYAQLADSEAVFARYYLALRCAPIGFARHEYISAKLLYMLSRLYGDAGNKHMEEETASKALESFQAAYEGARLTPKQEQQVCVLIGELFLKRNDLKNAMSYFSRAKTGEKTSALCRHAENRIYDIRAMAAAQ